MPLKCFYLRMISRGRIKLPAGGYLRLPIECIRIGVGKPKKFVPISYSGWYERRTEEIKKEQEAILADALREVREAEEAKAQRPENILYEAEKEIALQIMGEQLERQEKEEQRQRAFTALEIGKQGSLRGSFRERLKIKQQAKREAEKRLDVWDKTQKRQDEIKAQRLLNLEKARLAKEEKKKRQEEIKAQRLKNLKKARAAKKRKRKKNG